MATVQRSEELFACSICYGQLINPRQLPECLHTFCENCLLTYLNKLKFNDKDSCEFQCPNCRGHIPLPKATEDLQSWVKSLETSENDDQDMELDTTLKGENVNDLLCIPCKDIDKLVTADKHCIECKENLCASCSRIRQGLELLKGHTLIDIGDVNEETTTAERRKLTVFCPSLRNAAYIPRMLFLVCARMKIFYAVLIVLSITTGNVRP